MTKKILIADDEPDMLQVISYRLKKQGYETILAVDGKEALEKIKQHKPDLIIVDYRMPILNGFELAEVVHNLEEVSSIPIIVLTASAEIMTPDELAKHYINDHLTKPFEFAHLLQAVKKHLKEA